MTDQKKFLEKLSILRDDPLFWDTESFDPSLDAFNHEAYARALFKILTENHPPLSIGLFGPWGIGKSTIVSILIKLISQSKNSDLKPIYFNAWKYSGDAFRRQLLIEVAKELFRDHPDLHRTVGRLEQLNYADVLRKTAEKGIIEQVKDILTLRGIDFKKAGLARLFFAGIVSVIGIVLSIFAKSLYPLVGALISGVVAFLIGLKFEDVFVIQETSVYDPRLIFPEQFEAEFRKLIGPDGPLGPLRPVIVIDDIDRCEAATIRDILVSVKTFLGQENCFFVVPCDDKSITQIFQDPSQKAGYEDELLRKYFNVGVRIAPLMTTDLVDFANAVSKRFEMPPSVVQIAILANYRDARKMKHFLNTFSVKYAIAKAREKSGFMPVDIDQNLAGFAKAVLIEDLFPNLFSKMIEHPEIYGVLEHAALGGIDKAELTKLGLEDWEKDYPGLRAILKKTRTIKIEHVEVFLSLKTTNPEARIPRGFELKNSIVQGDESATEEIVKGISTDEARGSLAQLLFDLLDKTTDTFLKNAITASLRWCFREGLFAPADRSRIASTVSQSLVYNDEQKVLQQSASQALECAQSTGSDYVGKLVSKYERELSNLEQPTDSLPDTVNALYQVAEHPSSLSDILNKKFDLWIGTEKGLALLLQILPPEKLEGGQKLPSLSLVGKIASAISFEAPDAPLALNTLRKQVIFKNWDLSVAPPLAGRFVVILQEAASDAGYTQRLAFVIGAILENNECLEAKNSPQLWAHVQALYNKFSSLPAGQEIHRVILVFAATCPETGTKQAAKNFALQTWQKFTDGQLRGVLEFLPRFKERPREELRSALVQQEFTTLQNELQDPTDRTKQRLALCYENKDVLPTNALEGFLVKTLETQDSAFEVWRVVIGDYARQLGGNFGKQVADKCLALATNSQTLTRRQGFFELLATVLPNLDADTKTNLLRTYFALCKHSDQNIRNPASSVLEKMHKEADEQDFKLGVNSLVRDFCRMTPAEVVAFRSVLDASLQHSALFGDYEWRDLADLAKRALTQADTAIQELGLSLVERIPALPSEHEDDLVHVLISIARGSNAPHKDRAEKILRKLPENNLGSIARRSLHDYLNPPKEEQKDET